MNLDSQRSWYADRDVNWFPLRMISSSLSVAWNNWINKSYLIEAVERGLWLDYVYSQNLWLFLTILSRGWSCNLDQGINPGSVRLIASLRDGWARASVATYLGWQWRDVVVAQIDASQAPETMEGLLLEQMNTAVGHRELRDTPQLWWLESLRSQYFQIVTVHG